MGRWDSHGQNFDLVRDHGSKLDQCLSALIEDLDERGMLDDVTVVVWGEFGRTPKINAAAGRDHWTQVSCAFLAAAVCERAKSSVRPTDWGEVPQDRPVHMQEIVATLYHNLGIDTSSVAIVDPSGRPQYLVDHTPLSELI